MENTISHTFPTPLAEPFGETAPKIPAPAAEHPDAGYLDGSTAKLEGANPGRDQDRDRQCECVPASYTYPTAAFGSAGSETDEAEGY
jgi:hypothetical protein